MMQCAISNRFRTSFPTLVVGAFSCFFLSQEPLRARQDAGSSSENWVYLPTAQFQIPFNIDPSGSQPTLVQLLVSTDNGVTWQQHGRAKPSDRHFQFRAAAEGEYLFSVQTVDASGTAFPSPNPPLRVLVDTNKPQAVLRADMDHTGNLIVDIHVQDDRLDPATAILRLRTDRDSTWKEVPLTGLRKTGDILQGQVEVLVPVCREVALVFSIMDMAKNNCETGLTYTLPRTAANSTDLQFASTSNRPGDAEPGRVNNPSAVVTPGVNVPGAISWDPAVRKGLSSEVTAPANRGERSSSPTSAVRGTPLSGAVPVRQGGHFPTTPIGSPSYLTPTSPGQLAKSRTELELPPATAEEIPAPGPQISPLARNRELTLEPDSVVDHLQPAASANREAAQKEKSAEPNEGGFGQPFYCRARTFSLDYSVEALGGNSLSDVELWGSEDNGHTWQKWGTDPDRVSPFDVKVANDGLFGFRMVIVGAGGTVLGTPRPGDDADAWIRIDTERPQCKITRAVYGVGNEAGMLVVDYSCSDADLSEQGISLAWSPNLEGPWTEVASGLQNTGLYLWKADPGLPSRVYLKLEVVDKAGNIGVHRLDLPIDTKGLAPRGRIQGIRPIIHP
jgi:hypothetical protein